MKRLSEERTRILFEKLTKYNLFTEANYEVNSHADTLQPVASLKLNHRYASIFSKIWLKPSAEQQFLYGHHVSKSGLGRISENTEKYQGVIVYSMSDLPLGFGVAARSTAECKHAEPLASVCFHQADIGEYIRAEEDLL
ncbi:hypothetical protein NQ318_021030 [Aromia moschata]|uniref:60S ribosome subunit biogenesis protein NIP7 homolog n=1 Tax=Aromia moschata TaxID=1265417 RepID=A0AAV8YP67_9CUCU|nr:hypothetical protein NQ318_021030 [Aromia moschata]